jgi:hypothetical protein
VDASGCSDSEEEKILVRRVHPKALDARIYLAAVARFIPACGRFPGA